MNILVTTATFDATGFPEGANVVYNPHGRRLTEEEILQMVREHRPVGIVAGVEPLTRRVLLAAEGLKVISRVGIGLDSVDLDAARELGIRVLNTPDAPTDSVAEMTLGLMLCLARRLHTADAGLRGGVWKAPGGVLLKGRTVGVIGCGRIGTAVARLAAAFGCKLLGYDPVIREHAVCEMAGLDELLSASDVVTLHIPHTAQTHHLIGERELGLMKPCAMLINAARGGVVDEDALNVALASGGLMGAAVDCFAEEPYHGRLTELPNVLLTPHMGSAARESLDRMEREALRNLLDNLPG